ncbi:hypothetical protein ALT761_04086 [Alteromonas sp. 76-1]|jgi:hypothetical protein|uniref:hypothetical protein n=1 Tax=Alteromonas sp. 76-1 TaxID=2358187 RepID=UPI000FD17AE1|nr:hypothetical protein [Alteromonas sp. 76-1]VEL99051.1 hypothetical protein ALT761_04086 [Alteromonas sp. 76-1]
MKFSAYESNRNVVSVWAYPLFLVLILLLIHNLTGALTLPILDANHQRDFNTALGTTLLSGFFWLTIRNVHKNAASTLIAALVSLEKLSHFNHHRGLLGRQFARHLMWSTSIGVIMPIAYLLSEGLVTRIDEPEVLVIALTSIPFWLLLTLFILQVFSNTHYLQKLASTEHSYAVKELYLLREIFNMALSNTLIAVSGFALTPIFWINKSVPFFDIVVLTVYAIFISAYLFLPMIIVAKRMRTVANIVMKDYESEITQLIRQQANSAVKSSLSKEIESIETNKETLRRVLSKPQKLRLLMCMMPLPVSWLAFLFVESFY